MCETTPPTVRNSYACMCVLIFLVWKIIKHSSQSGSRGFLPALHLHSHPSIHQTRESNWKKRTKGEMAIMWKVKRRRKSCGFRFLPSSPAAPPLYLCHHLLKGQAAGRRRSENMDLHLARHVVLVKKVTRQQGAHLLLFIFLFFVQLWKHTHTRNLHSTVYGWWGGGESGGGGWSRRLMMRGGEREVKCVDKKHVVDEEDRRETANIPLLEEERRPPAVEPAAPPLRPWAWPWVVTPPLPGSVHSGPHRSPEHGRPLFSLVPVCAVQLQVIIILKKKLKCRISSCDITEGVHLSSIFLGKQEVKVTVDVLKTLPKQLLI